MATTTDPLDSLSLAERIERHRSLAESYHQSYAERSVQQGATYAEWVFADNATYASPYFGSELIDLTVHPISVQESATMEALAYSVRFDNWGPVEFQCWPSDAGFAMKSYFVGNRRSDGVAMGFHAYGFIDTDEQCRITHWETHVSREYDDFLDVAIGVHGPFNGQAEHYMSALAATLAQAGVPVPVQP